MENNEKLNNLRHTCAHLTAAAVLTLYPDAKITIGPAIEGGFYYDIDFAQPISEADLPKIEQKMKEILKTWTGYSKREVTEQEAKEIYKNNPYKLELIDEISKRGEPITLYKMGEFEDLCRGGHTDNPRQEIGAFKLLSLAGAYWRGSEKNKMLTRIYGTCFSTKEELENHLTMLEEAKKRDHKKLGKELDLFTFSPLIGPGLPLWTPKGTIIREELNDFIWKLRKEKGYQKVTIPHITKKDLYETSGHWDKFKDELFKIETREGNLFAMKPMNCPHHIQIFAHVPRSYKEMPVRFTETTMVYRDEQSGELSGLSRVRSITQDDAHVFLRKSQIEEEFMRTWDIIDTFYKTFGFELEVRLSLHDPEHMEKYIGDEEVWQEAEDKLRDVARKRGVKAYEAPGEAALYGPKIDFMTKDALGREWQVATIQLDLNLPKRFGLKITNEKGETEEIVMMHCAVMGSIERFVSILIEHYAGAFPVWLSPMQVAVLPLSDKFEKTASQIYAAMTQVGIRAEIDLSNQTIGAKIREATLQKVPYMCIIGKTEEVKAEETGKLHVSVRTREGKDLGMQEVPTFISNIKEEIEQKS